jgi:hypothetical protein
MTKDKLLKLYELLSEWIADPAWNRAGPAWANIVETKRQVVIDLKQIDPSWEEE